MWALVAWCVLKCSRRGRERKQNYKNWELSWKCAAPSTENKSKSKKKHLFKMFLCSLIYTMITSFRLYSFVHERALIAHGSTHRNSIPHVAQNAQVLRARTQTKWMWLKLWSIKMFKMHCVGMCICVLCMGWHMGKMSITYNLLVDDKCKIHTQERSDQIYLGPFRIR